jgi:peptidoglycan-associated lipoprotein
MRTFIVFATLTVLGLAGCKKSADSTEPMDTASAKGTNEYPGKDPSKSNIRIDKRLADLCSLPQANFAFDSAALSPQAKAALDALAECLVSGRGKDERLTLVGHADPRGDEEYNLGLGQRRASSVATYLEGKNLPADRMETSSRGELDATGTDEATWAQDRRVDIGLAE